MNDMPRAHESSYTRDDDTHDTIDDIESWGTIDLRELPAESNLAVGEKRDARYCVRDSPLKFGGERVFWNLWKQSFKYSQIFSQFFKFYNHTTHFFYQFILLRILVAKEKKNFFFLSINREKSAKYITRTTGCSIGLRSSVRENQELFTQDPAHWSS